MKGWSRKLWYAPPCLLLLTDQMLLNSAPYTQGLPWSRCSTTADGPRPQFLLPSSELLLVGSWITGPAPQIHLPGFAGERKAVTTISPTPLVLSMPGPNEGIEMTGNIVRVMMFQSLFTEIGITGWMLRMFCVPFSGP